MALVLNTPAQLDFVIYRGLDLQPIVITVSDSNGNIVDLTGWLLAIGSRAGGNITIASPNPPSGQVIISSNRQATKLLPVGAFAWDAILLSAGGIGMGPFAQGVITVKETWSPMFP